MPAYDFINDSTGETVELVYDAADVPKIGDVIQHEGQALRRVFCGELATADIARKVHKFPYASNMLDKSDERFKGCKRDKKGRVMVESQSHARKLGLVESHFLDY